VYVVYWSLRDPLCQSQSLPYLRSLARQGRRVALITFEQQQFALSPTEAAAERASLAADGITWLPRRYRKNPPVLSTVIDIGVGAVACALAARHARMVHARSSVPGAMALLATRVVRRPFFFDADGPLSQEYVDNGTWAAESVPHRMTRWMERRCFRAADEVAVLSEHRRREIHGMTERPVAVLPCAVDTTRFRPDPARREATRRDLGLTGTVFVYAGKPGGWYLTEPMFDFVAAARPVFGDVTILVLSGSEPHIFTDLADRRGLRCIVRKASREEMPAFLAAADVGLSFRLSSPSQTACSPIKNGEYLACGLPVVSTPGAGDYSELIVRERVGVVVDVSCPAAFAARAGDVAKLLQDPTLRRRCVDVALREVDLDTVVVPRYERIYARLLSSNAL
jgi:glycosyltransferase involved in cell wall biosynthesis